jgi:uncharacterized protein
MGKRIIDFLFKNALEGNRKRIEVSFWGGEPLLEWDLIKELIRYAEFKRKWFGVNVGFGGTTNGTLLTEEKIRYLADHRAFFMISLDGTPESHNKFRIFHNGDGSQSTIMRNVEKALKIWPKLKVRMSPYAGGIHRFHEDIRYLARHGLYNIMFSPVYESGWTEDHWKIWESECLKTIDFLAFMKSHGIRIDIEHFKSYRGSDKSHWPCGAGRFYVGFDIDGSFYPCHRFCKFSDQRPWNEKPMILGHIDYGITSKGLRDQFIHFYPDDCKKKECFERTPCHGGCFGVNYDMMGDIWKAPPQLCRYVEMQRRISKYYAQKIENHDGAAEPKPCTCNFEFYCGPTA